MELSTTVKQLENNAAAVRVAFDKTTLEEETKTDLREKLRKAEEWISFVKHSHGEHNIYLSSVTLRKADTLLAEIGQTVGGATAIADVSSLPLISGGYCANLCHARLEIKVPPETVNVKLNGEDKVMPHQMHIETLGGCVQCHELGGHKSVPLKPEAEDQTLCMECHSE